MRIFKNLYFIACSSIATSFNLIYVLFIGSDDVTTEIIDLSTKKKTAKHLVAK
jgi:hypothetical protein